MADRRSSSQGIIYLLENEAFGAPVIKIGRTGKTGTKLAERIQTLNIGVPLSFTCYRASLVDDAAEVEKVLHQVFHPAKRQWRGEFYEVEPWRVVLVLQHYEIEDMTRFAPVPSREDLELIGAAVREKDRRAKFTFAMLEIPEGSKLTLVGSPEIECEVADDQTGVLYEGERYALSTLATKLKHAAYVVQGLRYWLYEDQTLLKRRDEILERQELLELNK